MGTMMEGVRREKTPWNWRFSNTFGLIGPTSTVLVRIENGYGGRGQRIMMDPLKLCSIQMRRTRTYVMFDYSSDV